MQKTPRNGNAQEVPELEGVQSTGSWAVAGTESQQRPSGTSPTLTLLQAAERLGFSCVTLRRMVRSGTVPAIQLCPGGHYRIPSTWVDAQLRPSAPPDVRRHAPVETFIPGADEPVTSASALNPLPTNGLAAAAVVEPQYSVPHGSKSRSPFRASRRGSTRVDLPDPI